MQPVEINSDTLEIPPLLFGPIKQTVGYIQHLINGGGERQILLKESIQISPKIHERLYTLSDGQRIIVTRRRKINVPEGVDGVLQKRENEEYNWIYHQKLVEFKSRMLNFGLSQISQEIMSSWDGQFQYRSEERDSENNIRNVGLRSPQIGGLHAIGAHWSVNKSPATIVMPTGTGKTETMLAAMLAHRPGKILVVVPSKVLRDQTLRKFTNLGLLRFLGNISQDVKNPVVGVITNRPRTTEDLEIFDKCNVVLATMSALGEESVGQFADAIAARVQTLIVDEAHHIAAKSWSSFRESFNSKKVLQFTATPYRRDGKLVDGKVIFEYPLRQAQLDGYFKSISFDPVYEIEQEEGDKAIAIAAVSKLRNDLEAGFDHIVMARCESIHRATSILAIYKELATDFNPIIVHSKEGDTNAELRRIFNRESRIVVCVNMLGEGFDLPQLKIAAVHDTHKSLAILLQFTGRFTRTSGNLIGDATIIANIADQEVSAALERLYSEDADWNDLLSEFSSEAARSHSALISFLNDSERLGEDNEETIEISHHLLRPTLNTLTYNIETFTPRNFFEGISKEVNVHKVWLHQESNTLYFVTRTEPRLRWTRSREIVNRMWEIFVLHYDTNNSLLYLSSSDKSSFHEKLAKAVGGTSLVSGDVIFKALGRITRLIFQNVGVKKHGRRNLSYAQYTGADVATALGLSERQGSSKSNLSGSGWENGKPITIGCSIRGRVWARDLGSIPELIEWCEQIGSKFKDESIDTRQIIANVLIPKELDSLEDKNILSIEWPLELLKQSEERVTLFQGAKELSISMMEITASQNTTISSSVKFTLNQGVDEIWAEFQLLVGGAEGFLVTQLSGSPVRIKVGALETLLSDYFSDYPPLVRFIDLSELDGNLLIEAQDRLEYSIPQERFESWDWSGIDISKESIIKNGAVRTDSIQWFAAQNFISADFDLVFNDDAPGEAADLVCLKEEEDHIRLVLAHCKFTKGTTAGERVQDVVEVCSQAIKSAKWKWKFKDLCQHILKRERKLLNDGGSRFMAGNPSIVNRFGKLSRFKEIRPEILIIQPGISKNGQSSPQSMILGATHSYLKETIGVDLDIICSD